MFRRGSNSSQRMKFSQIPCSWEANLSTSLGMEEIMSFCDKSGLLQRQHLGPCHHLSAARLNCFSDQKNVNFKQTEGSRLGKLKRREALFSKHLSQMPGDPCYALLLLLIFFSLLLSCSCNLAIPHTGQSWILGFSFSLSLPEEIKGMGFRLYRDRCKRIPHGKSVVSIMCLLHLDFPVQRPSLLASIGCW